VNYNIQCSGKFYHIMLFDSHNFKVKHMIHISSYYKESALYMALLPNILGSKIALKKCFEECFNTSDKGSNYLIVKQCPIKNIVLLWYPLVRNILVYFQIELKISACNLIYMTHTWKNSEKNICPFLENEDFFSQNEHFFLKTANYSPI